jgi:hypothetical protein
VSRHHYGARLHDYVSLGYRTIALENEIVRVEIVVDKGSDITSFLHKPSDTDFMWHRETGLRRAPIDSVPRGTDESVFVDLYEGGWQECFPNGGESVLYKGARLPFHGELLAATWDVDVREDRPDVVSVRLSLRTMRTPFVLEKVVTLRAGAGVLQIDERVTNLADEEMEVMWGHHPAFGPPFLDASCRIDLPPCTGTTDRAEPWPDSELAYGIPFVWPLAPRRDGGDRDLSAVPGPEARISDWVRLTGFAEGWYGVTNTDRRVGFGLRWDAAVFPHLWFWHVFGGMRGYPWYGLNYNFALEPWSSYPDGGLLRAIANGSALRIGPRSVVETRLFAVAYAGVAGISAIDAEGNVTGRD